MEEVFSIQPIRLYFKLEKDWQSPFFMGSGLRGIFGHSLNQLGCNMQVKSKKCKHLNPCVYHQVFSIPNNPNNDKHCLPPPFVIQAPELGEKTWQAGDILHFNLLLFNQAIPWLPQVLQAWANANFKQQKHSIRFLKAELLDKNLNPVATWYKEEAYPAATSFIPNLCTYDKQAQDITLNFITPLHLREKGKQIRPQELTAEHLVMSALRRLKLLNSNWQKEYPELNLPYEVVKAWAKSLVIEKNLTWQPLKRWSNSQHQEVPISGMLGKVRLLGNLEPFMLAIQILPYMGIGKNCNLGLGQVKLGSYQ